MTDETALALQDGTTVRVRPIQPDDRQRLLAMWDRTGAESRRRRFQGAVRLDESNIGRFTDLDPETEYALVATLGRGEEERIVGVGRYACTEVPGDAEFALLVEDAHQGRGIGTGLLRQLALHAKRVGIATLSSEVLTENSPMLSIIEDLGLRKVGSDRDMGVIHTDLAVDIGDDFLRVRDEKERAASIAAVGRFLAPERVAVVGASRDRDSVPGLVFASLLAGGFDGPVYPVNPEADHVQGVAAYPTLADCPAVPDLVLVATPAAEVTSVVDEAGRLGVVAVVVVSGGFAETGADGRRRQQELIDIARGHGLRLVGPNCMGVLNARSDQRMNATFSTTFPRPGTVSMCSQSGALGLAVLDAIATMGLGLATFVSIGNSADITVNDLLDHWSEDDGTDVVLLYLESFDDPRAFSRIARRLSRRKPVVAVKSGRTAAGRRRTSSHTAAVATGDIASAALFRQTGIIRTDTLQEMLDVALLLERQALPAGPRVGIVSNAGGAGILAADACITLGLAVPEPPPHVRTALAVALPDDARIGNPVDLPADAPPEDYHTAITALGGSGEIDAVVVVHVPTGPTDRDAVGEAVVAARDEVPETVPLLSVFASERGVPHHLAAAGVPSFSFPEDAAKALAQVHAYADWRDRPLGEVVRPDDIDPARARAVVRAALDGLTADDDGDDAAVEGDEVAVGGGPRRRRGCWLPHEDAQAVLRAYGVPMARTRLVTEPDEAAAFQRDLDAPVVVKSAAPIHKTDIGAIRLDLRSPDEAAAALRELRAHLAGDTRVQQDTLSFLVQEMVGDGIEMVVGVTDDASFGPLLVTGMGGVLVELVRDVAVRVTPVTDRDVADMLDQLRMRPLLDGYRGAPAKDVAALTDLLHRIGALVEDVPELVELDCNPVFVRAEGQGVLAVDVRVRVAPAG